MRVLTRYLVRAHIGPFVFALVALTGVILINTLAKELANLAGKGLPMSVVAEFFVLSLPANIALTLPMAVLVSVLYTFSNLASENEITALRASGVDLRRAAMPLIVAASIIATGMVWFSDQVLPAANYRWRMLMTDVAAARPLLALREQTINPITTTSGLTPYYLEAQRIDASSGTMWNVSIYDVSESRVTRTISADSGRMAFNSTQTDLLLTLFDGSIREIDFNEMASFQTVMFKKQVMRMEGVSERLERSDESTFRTDRDMTLAMMRERIGSLRSELATLRTNRAADSVAAANGELPEEVVDSVVKALQVPADSATAEGGEGEISDSLVAAEIARARQAAASAQSTGGSEGADSAEAASAQEHNPEAADSAEAAVIAAPSSGQSERPRGVIREDMERYATTRVRNVENQIREFQVEIQKKYAIAVATLVFVLIGIPIALRFPRGGVGMVIGVSLAIFGIYYVGLIGGETLGDGGYVSPSLAMWITNIIFGALGIFGFLRLGREQGTGRGGGWGELPKWLRIPRASPAEGETA
ncbi:MAG: LptF/LptG family permease [Gemmatimonas sp.]|nr:LptF/LptG family permease [Gemmatimonas sp.]